MKKLFLFLTVIALLVFCSPSFASVGVRVNGVMVGTATDININCGAPGNNLSLTPDGSIYNINCSPNLINAGLGNAGYVSMASTVTAIPIGYSFIRKVIDSDGNSAFTAGTLPNGYPGQILTIYAAGLSPSGATTGGNYTITPTTATGFTSIKLSAVNDVVTFEYLNDTLGWVIVSWDPGASNSITITLRS